MKDILYEHKIENEPMNEERVRSIIRSMEPAHYGNRIIQSGYLKSQNFLTGSFGWQIDAQGNAEFNNGTFRGTFTIGGTLITVSDIANLAQAITDVSNAGGGTVALVPNTYTATQSYSIPSGVTIDGNGATIDFGGGAYQFLIQGSNAYSTGTVAINYASSTVTGSGTTWTAGMVGQSILIADFWYVISARSSNTSITLAQSFMGTNVSGVSYVIATTIGGVGISNITLTNSSTSLIRFRYVNGMNLSFVATTSSIQGIDGDDSANVNLLDGSFVDHCVVGITYDNVPFTVINNILVSNITGGTGIALNGVNNTAMGAVSVQAITGRGITFTNCSNFGLNAYAVIECSSHGIELISGCHELDIIDGEINSCGGDGLRLTATDNGIIMSANSIINNTGWGVNIVNANCNNNILIGTYAKSNTAGSITDSGTGTLKSTLVNYLP